MGIRRVLARKVLKVLGEPGDGIGLGDGGLSSLTDPVARRFVRLTI